MKSKFLYQDVDVVSLADKGIVVSCFVCRNYDKVLMETGKFCDNIRVINKSPKGHWSLTWVQWALLLKVRFLSKSESTTAIFVKSVRTATMAIFQFRIRGCIQFVAVAFRSEEEVLWRKGPSLTYLMRHMSCNNWYASEIYVTGLVPCLVNAVDFLLYNTFSELHAVSSYLSCLHTLELHIQVHQLCTNNKHNTYLDPPVGGFGWKA